MELKPTVISTFCGTGGSSLGYKWAGFKELLAIDFDKHAVECFKANFPEVPVWLRDITTVTADEILKTTGIKKGELDVFDGSPPCQGFSTAGSRVIGDPRNDLFKSYLNLIVDLQPKVFVMENVTGMVKGKFAGTFKIILKELKERSGYNVKCKQMNAKYYNVPQARERLIFIGVRPDIGEPSYPLPNNNIITVREALKGVAADSNKEFTNGVRNVMNLWPYMKPGQKGTVISTATKKKYGYNGLMFSLIKIHPDKPAPTVIKSSGDTIGMMHWIEKRLMYVSELKRICSFPDNWVLTGDRAKQVDRLGNAVMPRFMQAIAENIKTNILHA